MKRKSIITIIIGILLFFNSTVFAAKLKLNTDYTEDYKKYLEASEEEKRKYTIIPNQYNFKQNKTKITNPVTMMNTLGANNDPYYSLTDSVPNELIVRDQQDLTLCWCFASLTALATNLGLNNVSGSYDFSARHMDYACAKDTLDGLNTNPYGINRAPGTVATWGTAINYLTNGIGAVNESSMPMNYSTELVHLDDILGKTAVTETYDVKIYPEPTTDSQKEELISEVKKNIRLYGAVPAQICGDALKSNSYYNSSTFALYTPNTATAPINHAVTIIGWDDNFALSNFNSNNQPPSKGAWIVQNSWGTEFGNDGLVYISYYDKNISKGLIQVINSADKNYELYQKKYDNNYLHDRQGFGQSLVFEDDNQRKGYLGTKFTAKNTSEYLSMVSVAVLSNCECKVYANTLGDSLDSSSLTPLKLKSGEYTTTLEPGYNSIELQNPVQLSSTNKNFAIVLEITNTTGAFDCFVESNSPYEINSNIDISGKCFVADEEDFANNQWLDLKEQAGSDLTVRAYTLNSIPTEKTLTGISIDREPNKTAYNAGEYFNPNGMIVKALYNDNSSETITDYVITNGSPLSQGQEYVTVSYNNFTVQQPVTVYATPADNGGDGGSNNPNNNTPDDNTPNNNNPNNNTPDDNTDTDTNTIPNSDLEPNNNTIDVEPQNSLMNNLKPTIIKLTSEELVINVSNFTQNKNNDTMTYSFYLSTTNQVDPTILNFIKLDNYKISGNNLQFSITEDMVINIESYENLDSADSIYLIIKETATLGDNAKTAYSTPSQLKIDDDIVIDIGDFKFDFEVDLADEEYTLDDDTVAKDPIPQTGVKQIMTVVFIVGLIGCTLVGRYIILKRKIDGK